MQKPLDRHLAFFNLQQALQENQGCCVCSLQRKWTDGFIESILNESVTDKFFRLRLSRTEGFCQTHAWRIAACNSPLGSAILFNDTLTRAVASMKNTKIAENKRLQECLLCQNEKEAESRYISVLAASLGEPDFLSIFERSSGLCIPHLKIALANTGKKNKIVLMNLHREKFTMLAETMQRYIDKFDYSNRGAEMNEEEKASWKKAIAVLVKQEGII